MHARTPSRIVCLLSVCLALAGCDQLALRQARQHFQQGQQLAKTGKNDAALAELRLALKYQGDMARAHTAIGDIHRRQNHWDQARLAYEQACHADPYAFRPHYNLGVTYQVLARGAKLAAETGRWLRQAVDVYLRAAQIQPNDFDTRLNLSACYYQTRRYVAAEQQCRRAVALNSDSPRAWANLGMILAARGRCDQAIGAYHASLERKVDQPQVLVDLGKIHIRQGRPKAAMRNFEMVCRRYPKYSPGWVALGQTYYRLGYYEQALKVYRYAAAVCDEDFRVQRAYGVAAMTAYLLDRRRYEQRANALQAWRLSLALHPAQHDLVRLVHKYSPPVTGPMLGYAGK